MKYPVRKLFRTYILMYSSLIIFILKIIYKSFYFLLYVFPDRFIFYLFYHTYFSFFKFLLTLAPSDGLRLAYTGQNINTRVLCQILHFVQE